MAAHRHYTHTTWIVKPGYEDEFVRRWAAWADWSRAEGLAANATLLRDVDEPNHFVSFGPWETIEAVRRWRAEPGFQQHVERLHEVVERFEPHTYALVAEH